MNVFNVVANIFSGTGKVAGELYRFARLLVIAVIVTAVAAAAYFAYSGIGVLTSPFHWWFSSGPAIPANLPEKVSEERQICRAHTLLADFKGSSLRLDADKIRVLRTIAAYHRIEGVDDCEIFRRQMELVVPGSGSHSIFNRRESWVSKEFTDSEKHEALLLAREVSEHPDLTWDAIVLIRPPRSGTIANQSDDEIKTIENQMELVPLDGPSEFRFFRLKPRPKPK